MPMSKKVTTSDTIDDLKAEVTMLKQANAQREQKIANLRGLVGTKQVLKNRRDIKG